MGAERVDIAICDPVDQHDVADDRQCMPIKLDGTAITLNVMFYAKADVNLRPLVVLNSIDFPMPPSKAFCETLRSSGLRVIYIERPGFGAYQGLPNTLLSNPMVEAGAAVTTEAAVVHKLLDQLRLRDFVLLCMGSSNPVGYRLAKMNRQIALTVFSNAMLNQDALDVFRPLWFQQSLKRALRSKTGMKLSISGTKYALKRAPAAFYRQVFQKSQGDLRYFEMNEQDFMEASLNYRSMDPAVISYDVRTSMQSDRILSDHFFANSNCIAFTSHEVDSTWKRGLELEAKRLSLPITYAPEGDFFAPYVCPDHLISIVNEFT